METARTILTASDGTVLTDGEIYGKILYLAEGADADLYYEITEEEYEKIVKSEEAEEADYIAALGRFGVT